MVFCNFFFKIFEILKIIHYLRHKNLRLYEKTIINY